MTGIKYDTQKNRYDLIHPKALDGMVEILTFGAEKYADRNWEQGMNWSRIIGALKRHMAAIEAGEDYDPESGKLHIDHVQCCAHFLSAYYRIYPQGDDRPHKYLSMPKIGLDIDEVLADWLGAWTKRFNLKVPTSWFFDRQIGERFQQLKDAGELEEFYANLEPLVKPEDIPFEPHCYITSRPCTIETTMAWLDKHGFPTRPVYAVDMDHPKVEVAKQSSIDWFVDDRYRNFVELNNAGICTFLMNTPHNQRYDVGHKRIYSLKELVK